MRGRDGERCMAKTAALGCDSEFAVSKDGVRTCGGESRGHAFFNVGGGAYAGAAVGLGPWALAQPNCCAVPQQHGGRTLYSWPFHFCIWSASSQPPLPIMSLLLLLLLLLVWWRCVYHPCHRCCPCPRSWHPKRSATLHSLPSTSSPHPPTRPCLPVPLCPMCGKVGPCAG